MMKHRRTTLERAEKFISPLYFTDVNLRGRYIFSYSTHNDQLALYIDVMKDLWFDTIHLRWFIVVIKGSHVIISK